MLGSGAGGEGGGGRNHFLPRPVGGRGDHSCNGRTHTNTHQHHRPPPPFRRILVGRPPWRRCWTSSRKPGAGPGRASAKPAGGPRGTNGAGSPGSGEGPTVRAPQPRPGPRRSAGRWLQTLVRSLRVVRGRLGDLEGSMGAACGLSAPLLPPHSPPNPPKSAPRPAPGRRRASRPGPRSRGRRRRRRRRRARANREGQPPPPLPPAPPPPPTDSDLRAARCIALTRRRPVVQPTRSRSAPPAFVETAFGPSGVASGGGKGGNRRGSGAREASAGVERVCRGPTAALLPHLAGVGVVKLISDLGVRRSRRKALTLLPVGRRAGAAARARGGPR